MSRILFLSGLGFLLTLGSCKKEKDFDAPEIKNLNVDGEFDEIYLSIGDTFEIQATVTDNIELSQLKLDIHSNFDSHQHKNNLVFFSQIEIYDINGSNYEYLESITIPENVKAGPYHVGIYALDKTGNQSAENLVDLIVTRPDAPVVDLSAPDFTSLVLSAGDTLRPEGVVIDDGALEKVIISLRESNGSTTAFDQEYEMVGDPIIWDLQADGNIAIVIDQGLPAGKYTLLVRAEDDLGNVTLHKETLNLN